MMRAIAVTAATILVMLGVPCGAVADYVFPGSAALQPLAVIEPATPDSLFLTWTGDIDFAGERNLGLSADFLRSEENSDDWDVIFIATGSFRSGNRLLWGITAPFLIRDPNFNESGLLDLRVFARMRLLGTAPGLRVAGEVSGILPTGKEDDDFPLTLESPVAGARLAFAGGSEKMRAGVNVGYQTYLATESGNDSDITYGIWMEKEIRGSWKLSGIFTSSTHDHSGAPGDDEVTDSYAQIGVRRAASQRAELGFSLGSGTGGDSAADLRMTATATFRFGEIEAGGRGGAGTVKEAAADKKAITKKKAISSYQGPVVVMIAEGIADKNMERSITRVLQRKGFATGMDPDPGIRVSRKNVLWYNKGMKKQAESVLQTLVQGGYLKKLEIRESSKPIMRNWMILVPGGEGK
ncbi:MAG: hypothetical protein PVJ01_03805 [Pseudomonadota bacterium]|jgi:hypothetical protein